MDPAAKPTLVTTLRPPGAQWACAECTLFNAAAAKTCGACEAPRPKGEGRGRRRKKPRLTDVDGATEQDIEDGAAYEPTPKRRASPSGAPKKRARKPAQKLSGEAERQRLNAQLRRELAAAKVQRAAFYGAHRSCLAPFTAARDLDALAKAASGAVLPPRKPCVLVQPENIRAELRDYQLQSLDYLADRHERCGFVPSILGDEMGLGKTLQTIAYLAWLKFEKKLEGASLVLCPLSVLSTWTAELKRWCPELRVLRLHSSDVGEREKLRKRVVDDCGSYDVVVTTYEMAKNASLRTALVQKVVWRVLVLDEGHVVKNVDTEIAQTVRKMHFCTVLLLTGTPLQNNLVELWALLNFLHPEALPDRTPFDKAYNLGKGIVDKVALSAAQQLLSKLMLRRLKTDVESGLPPKLETVVSCPLAAQQLFWYRALLLKDHGALARVEKDATSKARGAGGAYKSLLNLLMQLRKTCCHPFLFADAEGNPDETTLEELVAASGKLRVLDRLLVKLHASKHRVVIFSQFAAMVDVLDDYCRLRGWPFCRLTGATNRVRRSVNVKAFNEPASPLFLFLMTTRAGGLGINLQSADTCFLYDSDWNPQADLQAMARVHRLGQTKTVHIYRLCAAGTAEERVLQRSQKKLYLSEVVNRSGDSNDTAQDAMTATEVLIMVKFGAAAIFDSKGHEEPSDADLDAIIDRNRTDTCTIGNLKGNAQANAQEFDATTTAVDTRNLFGLRVDAAPASMQDVASAWTEALARTPDKRVSKNRIHMVQSEIGLVPVLGENAYDLEDGEASVFARELKGSDRAKFEVQHRRMIVAGRDYQHDDRCLACHGACAGQMKKCRLCPVQLHATCAVNGAAGKDAHNATWQCPQHACSSCARSTSAAGGMLFRCEGCVNSFCEDCLPKDALIVGESRRYLAKGAPAQAMACYIRCSKKCVARLAKEDKAQPQGILKFEPLDLSKVDERNKSLFEEASTTVGAGDVEEEHDEQQRKQIRASVRSILVQELLDWGQGDEFGGEGAPRFRLRLQFHGSRHPAQAGETGGFRGAAKRILDGVIHKPRAVAAALEALIEDGELVIAPGAASCACDEKHDGKYDAGSLIEAVKALRTTRVAARAAAASALASRAKNGMIQALLHDPSGGYAPEDTARPVAPRNRFEPGRMCRIGYDCRGRPRTQGHVCYLFPTRSERDLIRDVMGRLADEHAIEVVDDQNNVIAGHSVALRWQEVKGVRAARTPAVAKALEERRDARRSLVDERRGKALERVDASGWAVAADLFGHKGDKRAQEQALVELVETRALVAASTPKLGTRYARPAYSQRHPFEAWVDRKDPRGDRGSYRGVAWDKGAQQWRAQDLQGVSVGFFDDLEAAAKARDDAVFDPRNPAYAYRGRAQPNFPRHTTSAPARPWPAAAAPPHGHVFPANGHVFPANGGVGLAPPEANVSFSGFASSGLAAAYGSFPDDGAAAAPFSLPPPDDSGPL